VKIWDRRTPNAIATINGIHTDWLICVLIQQRTHQ